MHQSRAPACPEPVRGAAVELQPLSAADANRAMEEVADLAREAAGVVFVELTLVHGGGENSPQIAAGGEKDGVAPWCAKGGRERAGAAASPELADIRRDVPSCSLTDARASRSRSPRPAVPMATPLTQPRSLWRAGVLRRSSRIEC